MDLKKGLMERIRSFFEVTYLLNIFSLLDWLRYVWHSVFDGERQINAIEKAWDEASASLLGNGLFAASA